MRSKEVLRSQLKDQRRALTPGQMAKASQQITARVLQLVDWATIATVHTYTPIVQQREVDTAPLIGHLKRRYPHIAVATWQYTDGEHKAVWLSDPLSAVPAGFQFEVIIVPLLGFNRSCFRIGFGGGFYDRFLLTQPKAATIGLGYAFGYTAAFSPEPHDVPLHYIATDDNVYVR